MAPAVTHIAHFASSTPADFCGAPPRPTLMRPPYGLENGVTQRAAAVCQMKAVVEWSAVMNNGRLTTVGGHLQPGYIILLHFRRTLLTDLEAAVAAIEAAGLTVGRLESYLA
jgi:hypothetical protein